MAIHMLVHSSLASASARGIRVVFCEPHADTRAQLRSFIDPDPVLTLVAETGNWTECDNAVQDFGAELLIARADLIPPDWAAGNEPELSFPVVIALRADSIRGEARPGYSFLPLPATPDTIRKALAGAVRDIYDRKAKQLLYLVDKYVAASSIRFRYSSTITAERDGRLVELRTEDIMSIVAARKFVSIHAISGQFRVREPIHSLSARLDPRIFIRIHRSIIVNCSYVDSKVPINPRASHVAMVNGSEFPVGPNYRDALCQAIKSACDAPSFSDRSIS
jgi:two-component system LytT family response regulator